MEVNNLEYVGFWPRVGAAIVDSLLIMVTTFPVLISIYGWEYLTSEKLFRISQGPA